MISTNFYYFCPINIYNCFMNNRPLILVSNDDGYQAKGINSLLQVLKEFGDVVAVAPHTGRSGKGCAITSETPIKTTLARDILMYRNTLRLHKDCMPCYSATHPRSHCRRYQPWRQFCCQCPLFGYYGCCYGRLYEGNPFGGVLVVFARCRCRLCANL